MAAPVPECGGRMPDRLYNFHPVKSGARKRFRTKTQLVFSTQLHQIPEEVIVDTVGNRAAEIVQKPLMKRLLFSPRLLPDEELLLDILPVPQC